MFFISNPAGTNLFTVCIESNICFQDQELTAVACDYARKLKPRILSWQFIAKKPAWFCRLIPNNTGNRRNT